MRKIIQNLLMPFAILAMLTVGAFTINASEKTDNAIKVEEVVDIQAQDPYIGAEYYRVGTTWVLYTNTSDGHCSLDGVGEICTKNITGVGVKEMFGEDQESGEKLVLRRIVLE
ncbi:hypothetical protein LNQ81_12925 [Myroides sp. M-43]|uniref:hypothetical protein n=1 Tax=Myroides oncorhynchi TaxID=2893756 RepID=UPI001E603818|nr:hypothetical protein [Myroides oncorhynchi]MCC9043577.1 hypothetical protein [Myroides oncorhynchi]